MNIKPLTQTRQDYRRRRYAAGDEPEEEVDHGIAPEMPPPSASWSTPLPGVGSMTTVHFLAIRQTVSPDPE